MTKKKNSKLSILVISCLGLLLAAVCTSVLVQPASAGHGQGKSRKISSRLLERNSSQSSGETARVIIQLGKGKGGALVGLLNRNGIKLRKEFKNLDSAVVDVPIALLPELEALDDVHFLTEDEEIVSFGHVSSTTGADDVRSQSLYGGSLDGSGIGIAVLDSGIYAEHKAFNGRVVYSKDFTGENRTDDPFGHGTHVAGAAAGNAFLYSGSYTGIAPNATLINLRVLNSKGRGSVSGLLSALDWVYSNRGTHNIRVVVMSLGGAAVTSYKNDPLCLAVRRLADAGVVVVAAAGNDGKDAFGRKQYGGIHSPGIEPSALTVGATNSLSTNARNDDGITSYSSRGPTRSYWTDANGVRHYDNLIKPDLVAPGNKLAFAASPNNLLVAANPDLEIELGIVRSNQKMMYMSGTSVSTPIVAGAVALVLQANPKLTPNMVKMVISYTAQQLRGVNTLEQGAGQLNIEGAVRLARLVRTDLSNATALGSSMLRSSAPTPQSTIDGTTFLWAQGIITDHGTANGFALITKYQQVYDLGVLLSDATLERNGFLVADQTMISTGVMLSDQILIADGSTLNSGIRLLPTGVLLSDGVLLTDGVMLADGVLISDGVLLTDGVLLGDGVLVADRK